jgi:hypothetical protein
MHILHRSITAAASTAALCVFLLLVSGCAPEVEDEAEPEGPDITGTWEVVDEPEQPFSRSGQRYTFAPDSTLRIFRPRPLGPASTIFAVYDFRGDTLAIRSEFDAELLFPHLAGDTLVLDPVGGGRPLTLVRVADAPAQPPPPADPPGDGGVYSPPADVPPEDQPRD